MMNLSDTDLQLLEDFWNENLPPEKKQELEERLANDTEFRMAAEDWKMFYAEAKIPPTKESLEAEEIKNRLLKYSAAERPETAVDKEKIAKKTFSIRPIYYLLSAAAAVALILLWLNFNDTLFEADPASRYFTHLSRDNANLSPEIENGEDAYDQKKYKRAYTLLLEEVAEGSDSLNLIYASVAAIGSQQAEKAIPILAPLVNTESWRLYQSEIQWYLALAYLQEGEKEKAKEILQIMIDLKGEYSKNAQELMEQIK